MLGISSFVIALKVLTVLCETVFGFLEQFANPDSNGFLRFGNLMVLLIQDTERDFHRNLRFHRKQKNPIIHIFLKPQSEIPFRKHCTVAVATASKLGGEKAKCALLISS